ncbi:hypothetical protein D3C81_1935450 [compost metagenome]
MAGVEGLLQGALRGAIQVAKHFGLFQEVALFSHAQELGALDEVVVHPVGFSRAHGARGVGDRHANVRLGVDQGLDQAGLAGAGRSGNDKEGAATVVHVLTQCSALVHASVRSRP